MHSKLSLHKIVEKLIALFNTLQTQSGNRKIKRNQLQIVAIDTIKQLSSAT
jgi:hypothetical protein